MCVCDDVHESENTAGTLWQGGGGRSARDGCPIDGVEPRHAPRTPTPPTPRMHSPAGCAAPPPPPLPPPSKKASTAAPTSPPVASRCAAASSADALVMAINSATGSDMVWRGFGGRGRRGDAQCCLLCLGLFTPPARLASHTTSSHYSTHSPHTHTPQWAESGPAPTPPPSTILAPATRRARCWRSTRPGATWRLPWDGECWCWMWSEWLGGGRRRRGRRMCAAVAVGAGCAKNGEREEGPLALLSHTAPPCITHSHAIFLIFTQTTEPAPWPPRPTRSRKPPPSAHSRLMPQATASRPVATTSVCACGGWAPGNCWRSGE